MGSKNSFWSFFVVISSMVFVGSGQQSPGNPGASLPCVQKLLPCQPFLKQPSNPTPACCAPLKQLVVQDPKCLCEVFNNPVLLKSLNITQSDALQLTKSCNANADISVCSNALPPTNSPSTPPSTPSSPSTPKSPPKSAAVGAEASFGFFAVLAFFILAI
ncbi:hypothetical protein ACH5RR_024879 [Cinchona calisaya]|uniref:Bifunctional inhibitor/plant lipid transfer protein/seed storage helical domain-containing protein n=1 Tax=Cinchona calisaya TaxID=153742 RepID=A0ABD2Z251_9GENT